MPAPIEAVTFDFWNTLALTGMGVLGERRLQAVAAAFEAAGSPLEEAALRGHLAEVTRRYEAAWESGELFNPERVAEALVVIAGLEEGGVEVAAAFLESGRGAELEFAPGIGECLEALAERGIGLAIVCDVGLTPGAVLREFLDAAGLLRHFGAWAFSDEVGSYKPSPRMFEAALGPLGVAPERAIHVGDLRRTDVAGARAFGMGTVRYRALNDDAPAAGEAGTEADHVHDRHAQLLELLDA